MPHVSPDAALFAALVAARPSPREESPPDELPIERQAVLVLRLADSVRHVGTLLREASALLAQGSAGAPRLSDLLAEAEAASLEQAACARGLLEVLSRSDSRRAA